jgi:hypothetical protein
MGFIEFCRVRSEPLKRVRDFGIIPLKLRRLDTSSQTDIAAPLNWPHVELVL